MKKFIFQGIVLVMIESLCRSSSQVVLRKLCVKKVHFSIPTIFTTFIGFPVALTISATLILTGYSKLVENIEHVPRQLFWHLFYVCIVGVIGSFNQIVFNLALKYEDAFKISLVKTADLFIVLIMQYFLLDININYLNLIGISLIVSSTLFILAYKHFDDLYWARNEDQIDNKLKGNYQDSKENLLKKILFYKF